MHEKLDKCEQLIIFVVAILYVVALFLISGCDQKRDTYPGIPYRLPSGETFTAQEFKMDMPRTFDSGSCIARGDTLLLRYPQMTWYCKESWGINSYYIEELLPDQVEK
jgi:hypothetical protein